MGILLAVFGVLLLVVAAVDAFWTTLWVDAAPAPLSHRLSRIIWKAARSLVPTKHDQLRSLGGPLSLAAVLLLWILLVWVGWTMILSADPQSLASTRDTKPVDLAGRIYFVAYTMFTMGNGDFYPVGDGWELVVSLIAPSGMILVTLAITYVLSVLPAVVQSRTLASQINSLGKDAETIVIHFWDGHAFPGLAVQLNAIASAISRSAQQYAAYPILNAYHGSKPSIERGVNIASFDDALTLLHFGVADTLPLPAGVIVAARSTVHSYLDTLNKASGLSQAAEPPPPPDLARLRAAGIPTVSDETFAERLDRLAERRKRLLGLVQHNGSEWPPSKK